MASIFGSRLKVSVFGQSHSPGIGVVIDGLPAGFRPDMEALRAFMRRRSPGQTLLSTQRQEADLVEVLSGMAGGRTSGAPLAAIIRNKDTRPGDYAAFRDVPRPGHADYPARVKHRGFQDASGGGHFSGRLTAPLCVAGALCIQLLSARGIRLAGHILSIADVRDRPFSPLAPELDAVQPGYLSVLDAAQGEAMAQRIDQARLAQDSVGGVVELAATGLPVGMGAPIFDGMENRIAQAVFGVPAVRGVAFGAGFTAAGMRGSQHNDPYCFDEEGQVRTRSNHHGGVLGGLTTGMPLLMTVAVRPTSSIFLPQESVDLASGQPATLRLKGRHDPCIVPRAVPCLEAALAIALYDAYLEHEEDCAHAAE